MIAVFPDSIVVLIPSNVDNHAEDVTFGGSKTIAIKRRIHGKGGLQNVSSSNIRAHYG